MIEKSGDIFEVGVWALEPRLGWLWWDIGFGSKCGDGSGEVVVIIRLSVLDRECWDEMGLGVELENETKPFNKGGGVDIVPW